MSQTKTLYLVRHAKSSHDNPDLKDIERPLADRGKKDALKVAKRLKSIGVKIDHILSSPSVRTQQTSNYFCDELGYSHSKIEWDSTIYRCTPMTLTSQIMNADDKHNSLMVFGHNPAITRCANYFQTDTLFDNVPTTGVVAIEFTADRWSSLKQGMGKLLFFEYPKKK